MDDKLLHRVGLMAEKLMINYLAKQKAPTIKDMELYYEMCYRISYGFHLKIQEDFDAETNG